MEQDFVCTGVGEMGLLGEGLGGHVAGGDFVEGRTAVFQYISHNSRKHTHAQALPPMRRLADEAQLLELLVEVAAERLLGRGDLRVAVQVAVPTKLSSAEEGLLRSYAEGRGEQVGATPSSLFSKIKSHFS